MQTSAQKGGKTKPRVQLGAFWLAWRTDRGEWAICWNDASARTRRRVSTNCRDYNGGHPPDAAEQALAAHYTRERGGTIGPATASDHQIGISGLLGQWLAAEGQHRARAEAYGYAVRWLSEFFDSAAHDLAEPITVDHLTPRLTARYIAARQAKGISGETIHAELAALKRALKWAWQNRMIAAVPFIGGVTKEDRSRPKDVEFSPEQVAALLDAAARLSERRNVHLFILIMLSTHARVEAVLEAQADQLRGGLFYGNAPDRRQTDKRRPIVPIAPTLAPWLAGLEGKLISSWSVRTSFAKCQIEAGLVKTDAQGNIKPLGSPNTLRHTLHTWLQTCGIPQAQIDAAAGHQEPGSGRNYTHLRPEYLKEFIAGVEAYWAHMDSLTTAHRHPTDPRYRSQCGPKTANRRSR